MSIEEAGPRILVSALEVSVETPAYSIFLVLAVVSTAMRARRGWDTRHSVIISSMIWIIFALSTAHWIADLTLLIQRIDSSPLTVDSSLNAVFTAFATINYGIADAVLVWRTWILCKYEYSRPLLIASLVGLGLTFTLILSTIILRIIINIAIPSGGETGPAVHGLNFAQVGTLIVSTITNLLATVVVVLFVWNNRRFLGDNLKTPCGGPTRGLRILHLVILSGFLHSFCVCFSIFASCYRLSFGTIGDMTNSALVHISGAYPTFVMLLAQLQGSLYASTFSLYIPRTASQTRPRSLSHSDPGTFSHILSSERSSHASLDSIVYLSERTSSILTPLFFSSFEQDVMVMLQWKWKQEAAHRRLSEPNVQLNRLA